MKKRKTIIALCLTVFSLSVLSGCATLRSSEKMAYKELQPRLEAAGLEPIKDKDAAVAGVLNVLPGIGNAYLGQWGLFACNLLFWPLSVTWGIPQAAIDAGTLNKQDTLSYYRYGLGKKELEEREKTVHPK